MSKASYALGKFLSNFGVLSAMVAVLGICALGMQIFAREDRHIDAMALLAPFVLVALPAMALTAALAVLFEMLPILRGGVLLGACGVGGGTSQEDEDCAKAGVACL